MNWIFKNTLSVNGFPIGLAKRELMRIVTLLNPKDSAIDNFNYHYKSSSFYRQFLKNKGFSTFTEWRVGRIIDGLNGLQSLGINKIHFVGMGAKLDEYKSRIRSQDSKIDCFFHGFLERNKVFEMYKASHLNLLPSNSEGFPKTISEGACFGAIPIVSNISSIPQYVNSDNGFLWDLKKGSFSNYIKNLKFSKKELKYKAMNAHKFAPLFTFDAYVKKLKHHKIL